MLRSLLLPVVALSLLASACAGMLIGTQSWFDQNAYGKQTLSKRASFDLSCPEEKLQYAGLGEGSRDYSTVGVTGCDKKVTYLFVNNSKWVLNTDAHSAK